MVKRRKLLQTVAGGAAAGTVLSAGAAADSQAARTRLKERYDDTTVIARQVNEFGEFVTTLSDKGYIGSDDVSEFNAFQSSAASVSENENIKLMTNFDEQTETRTALIRITETFDGGETNLFVLPEAERSYATVQRESGDEVLISSNNPSSECEFIGNSENCTREVCVSNHGDCGSVWTGCNWDYFLKEEVKVYRCDNFPYIGREVVNKYCTQDCCGNVSGYGCGCDSVGCP